MKSMPIGAQVTLGTEGTEAFTLLPIRMAKAFVMVFCFNSITLWDLPSLASLPSLKIIQP